MERPITRSELRSASASPSPPSDDEALERLRKLNTLQFTTRDVHMDDAPAEAAAQDDDDEMMFQLFAPTKSATTTSQTGTQSTAQKIRVRSPSVDAAAIGFLQPSRPRSFHFTDALSENVRATYEASALSGKQILELSTLPWPGSAYNWKVLHIPSSQVSKEARIASAQPAGFSKLGQCEPPTKRKRAGKKLRIKMRSKAEAAKKKQQAALKAKDEKEEAEKEKRTRRNREKKVKRKAKEKAKKAEGGGEGGGEEGEAEDSEEE